MLLHKSNLKCHLKFICDTSNILLLPNQAQAKDEDNRIKTSFVRTEIENFKTWVFEKMLAGELHWRVLCNIQIYFYSFWSENIMVWVGWWDDQVTLKYFSKTKKALRDVHTMHFSTWPEHVVVYLFPNISNHERSWMIYDKYILMCLKLELGYKSF